MKIDRKAMRLARLAAITTIAYLGACGAMFFMQRSFIYFPQPSSLAGQDVTVTLPAPDAHVVASMRPGLDDRAVVYLGGNGEDVTRSLTGLRAAFPHHSLYLLHYRGYGESTGKPSEAALFGDALAAFDAAAAGHADVQVVGRSLGSGLAVHVASVRPVSRLVLITPYDSLVELAARRFPFLPVRWLLLYRFESWRYAPLVKAPTLLLAAQHDSLVPPASTAALLSRFRPGVATMTTLSTCDHDSISERPEYAALLANR